MRDDRGARDRAGLAATVAAPTDLALEGTLAAPATDPALEGTLAAPATDPSLDGTLAATAQPASTRAAPVSGEGLAPGAALGRYVVLSRLGAGGMGEVYAAYDPVLDRRIAVKVIRPALDGAEARRMLLSEAQALAKLAHPNVVAVYDVGTVGDDIYIAMEYVDGQTVKAWLAEQPRAWPEIVALFAAAGRGLEAAHAAGLVHRDVKPDNVLVGKDGRVRVLDFGVALVTREGAPITRTNLAGTPAYMAPEQFGGGQIGPATDQFSFAVALYEALWKQRPFEGDTLTSIADNVCQGRVLDAPASDVPAWLRGAVMRALSRDPAQRFASIGALIAAIQPAPRRRWLPLAIAGAALVAVGAGVAIAASSRSHRAAPCTGIDRELAGIWDPARAQAVAHAVGKDAFPPVQHALDGYAHAWLDRAVAACRATAVTHEQTQAVLERRTACLDTRRRELDAAVTLLASGKVAADHAVQTAMGLDSLGGCDALAGLPGARPTAPPAELDRIEAALAHAHALRIAGKYKEALAAAADVVAAADKLHWGSEAAEAVYERAAAEYQFGQAKTAHERLFEVIRRGDEADDVRARAEGWILLTGVDAMALQRPDDGLRWAKHAAIALAKAGGDEELRGNLLVNTALADIALDRFADALTLQQQALQLYLHALGPEHMRIPMVRVAISNSYRRLGRLDDAIREGEAALALAERIYGKDHPEIATMLGGLGITYEAAGRYDDARAAFERSLAIKEQELGHTHASLAVTLEHLAGIDRHVGQFDAADALWQRAYDIRLAALGASHPLVTSMLYDKLTDRENRGLDAEGLALAREVVARLRAQGDAVMLPRALAHLCELERRAGQRADAAAHCAEAVKQLGTSPPDASHTVLVLAYAAHEAAERDPRAAAALLARAKTALAGVKAGAKEAAANVGWAEAHVLAAAGKHDDAVRVAHEARDALIAADGQAMPWFADDLARVR